VTSRRRYPTNLIDKTDGMRPRTGAGFTLVEMLITVVVIGSIIVFVIPSVDPDRGRVEAAMFSLGSTLIGAQREAVARQHDVMVTFDGPGSRVILDFDSNSNGVRDPGERRRVVEVERQVAFARANAPARPFGADPIAFATSGTGLPGVTFHRNGSASQGGGLYLTSRKAASGATRRTGDTRAIEIVRATGRAEWWRYDGAAWKRGF
jgi:prepilin-type N-terminal cleavage/methylation domain-containing protein